jgi:type III restriction enzyme
VKLHFEADLPYQANAIEAVCDLFRGQEVCRSEFTVTLRAAGTTSDADTSPLQGTLEGMAT